MDEVHGGSGFKRGVYASSKPNRIDALKKPPAGTAGFQPASCFPLARIGSAGSRRSRTVVNSAGVFTPIFDG